MEKSFWCNRGLTSKNIYKRFYEKVWARMFARTSAQENDKFMKFLKLARPMIKT